MSRILLIIVTSSVRLTPNFSSLVAGRLLWDEGVSLLGRHPGDLTSSRPFAQRFAKVGVLPDSVDERSLDTEISANSRMAHRKFSFRYFPGWFWDASCWGAAVAFPRFSAIQQAPGSCSGCLHGATWPWRSPCSRTHNLYESRIGSWKLHGIYAYLTGETSDVEW